MDNKKVEVKNRGKALQTLFWIVLVGYGVLYLISMMDWSFLKGEIIAYGLECEVKPQYNACPCKNIVCDARSALQTKQR